MNSLSRIAACAVPILTASLLAGCDAGPAASPVQAGITAAQPVPSVVTVAPKRMTIRRATRQPGQIEAFESTDIHARIAGYVRSLAVDIGDRIEAGQVLAELEVPELEADVQRKQAHQAQDEADHRRTQAAVEVASSAVASAEARVTEVRASIRRTEADALRWRAEYDRTEQLVRESAITRSVLDETRSKLEAALAAREEATAQVQLAEAAVAQSRAELQQARADVEVAQAHIEFARADVRYAEAMASFAKILAPYDGVVTARFVDTGHLTSPGGEGDPLFVVARTDRVRIAVGVPEVDAPLVNPGDHAEVHLQALDGRVFEGTVARISWSLDQATRTLRAEVDLENPEGMLRPGLYAYATIVAEERPDALTIPVAALIQDGSKAACMTVVNGVVQRRALEIGLKDGTVVEVLSGLQGDEAVVAANADSLAEGQPVQIADPTAK